MSLMTDTLAAVANGMAKLRLNVPLIGGWTLSMSNFVDNAGKNGNGTMMPQTFIEEAITPKSDAFIKAYHKAYNVTRIASPVSAAQGYDAVLILAAAITQAKSTDTKLIKLALEDLQIPVKGVIATWKKPFSAWSPANPASHEAFQADQVVMGVVKDGKIVFANDADKERLKKEALSVQGQ